LRITVPVGTRPEVIKLALVVRALRDAGHAVRCIATGQHADPRMSGHLFEALDCPPDATWELSGTEGDRVGRLLELAFEELGENRPDALLVLGDTYTAPLTAMAARRHGVGVIHLEAGLRSFNERSMEELNRRIMADLATVHLAPTEMAKSFLAAEGVPADRIRVVGNPVIDALVASGVPHVPLEERSGVLITAHRATNVDDPARLAELVTLVRGLGREFAPVLFPVHPRTYARLEDAGLRALLASAEGVELREPLPYEELLAHLSGSRLVVTDSGGLQEEASYFGVPAVVLRATTPRWESVESGAVRLTGLDAERAMDAVRGLSSPDELRRIDGLPCPYGRGDTARQVVAALADPELQATLSPAEPGVAGPPSALRGQDWAQHVWGVPA
jgi:UDP-N-acetylglucosamine 2-epimerase (non-hydrolysing)